MVEFACPIPIPAPADTDNAPLDALRSDTLANALEEALTVRLNDPAPEALASDTLFPPNNATLIPVPVIEVPPPLKDCVAAPAPGLGPTIVMELAPVLSVMLFPATKTIEPVLNAPAVPMPDTTLAVVADTVIVPLPPSAPTLTIPAPDNTKLFLISNEVDAAPRVLPDITPLMVE